MRRGVSIIAIQILFLYNLLGQPLDFKFTTLGMEKGLSSSNVVCITQDSMGYIWIGTQEGLNKFDGTNLTVYKVALRDSNSLPHNYIRCLFTDSQGTVWVGTDGGLCSYDPRWDNFKRIRLPAFESGEDLNRVDYIGENPEGSIFFAMTNRMFRTDRNKDLSSSYLQITSGEITSFLFDNHTNLWISSAKGGGLYKYGPAGDLVQHYQKIKGNDQTLSSNSLMSISLRNGNELWIATEDEGINCLDTEKNTVKRYPYTGFDEKFSRYTYVDNDNHLWVGDNTGIKIYWDQMDSFYGYYPDPNNPYSIRVNASRIFQDREGNYWVLHLPGGISLSIKQKGFRVFSDNVNETWHTQNKSISAVQEDIYGNLFLANPFNGIDVFHWIRGETIRFNYDQDNTNGLGSGATFCMEDDVTGMWVGTYRGGLQFIDHGLKKFISYRNDPDDPNSIAGNDIRDILKDSQGNIWVAVHGKGVDKFVPQEGIFYHYDNAKNNLTNDWTFEIIEDHLGNIWVASAYGVSRLAQGTNNFAGYFSEQDNPNSLSNNEIVTIFQDSLYRVWAGTAQGLNLYNREKDIFERVTGDLEDEYICGILDDNHTTLWVSTLNGLFNYNPKTGGIRRFDEADGLPTSEFNPRSCYKNLFNDFFFGSINGVVLFDPNNLEYNTVSPSVVITGFKLFNKEITSYGPDEPLDCHINMAEEVRLKYDQNVISFEFIAVSMIHPEKDRYSYKLEAFDDEWHDIGSRREVTYTNLDPGKYTFRVIASNNDMKWNEEGASIRVIVFPPWWKTFWFRILVIITILVSFISFFYLRTNKLRKQKLVLEEKVRKSTLELQEKNTQLVEKSNHLNETNTLLEERQQEILEKSVKLQELNTSKDRMFSIIAHDLTSPFNTILGFSELLQINYDNFSDKERKEMADTINDSAKRVYGLLDNLLNWARTQTNRIKYDPEELDLEGLIQESLDVYRFRLDKKNIKIELNKKTDKKPWADIDMIRSVLRNLISNASKFTKVDGKITISIEKENEEIRISITDTGIGISKETYNNLFNLDVSASQVGTDGEKGSGIGLILTNEFIGLNGGTLTIRSKEGQGSTFSFTLPVAED